MDSYLNIPSRGITFAPNVSAERFNDPPDLILPPDSVLFPANNGPSLDLIVPPRKPSHSKKKPDDWIPRPPNAFILFRSEFIKSQHVPGDVEANHGNLSKIIGLCWRNLPYSERDIWECKARIAMAEHKAKYPNYRFKPSQHRAGSGDGRGSPSKDAGSGADPPVPPTTTGATKRRVKEPPAPPDEQRCMEIASLLVCGMKGDELANRVRELDRGRGRADSGAPAGSGADVKMRFGEVVTPEVVGREQEREQEKVKARERARERGDSEAGKRRRRPVRHESDDDDEEYLPSRHKRSSSAPTPPINDGALTPAAAAVATPQEQLLTPPLEEKERKFIVHAYTQDGHTPRAAMRRSAKRRDRANSTSPVKKGSSATTATAATSRGARMRSKSLHQIYQADEPSPAVIDASRPPVLMFHLDRVVEDREEKPVVVQEEDVMAQLGGYAAWEEDESESASASVSPPPQGGEGATTLQPAWSPLAHSGIPHSPLQIQTHHHNAWAHRSPPQYASPQDLQSPHSHLQSPLSLQSPISLQSPHAHLQTPHSHMTSPTHLQALFGDGTPHGFLAAAQQAMTSQYEYASAVTSPTTTEGFLYGRVPPSVHPYTPMSPMFHTTPATPTSPSEFELQQQQQALDMPMPMPVPRAFFNMEGLNPEEGGEEMDMESEMKREEEMQEEEQRREHDEQQQQGGGQYEYEGYGAADASSVPYHPNYMFDAQHTLDGLGDYSDAVHGVEMDVNMGMGMGMGMGGGFELAGMEMGGFGMGMGGGGGFQGMEELGMGMEGLQGRAEGMGQGQGGHEQGLEGGEGVRHPAAR